MKGIIFTATEVRAYLDGRKTQVRVPMKYQPTRVEIYDDWHEGPYDWTNLGQVSSTEPFPGSRPAKYFCFDDVLIDGRIENARPGVRRLVTKCRALKDGEWLHRYHRGNVQWSEASVCGLCPCGVPGDRFRILEIFCIESNCDLWNSYPPPFTDGRPVNWVESDPDGMRAWEQCHYRATDPTPELDIGEPDPGVRWRGGLCMPEWATRNNGRPLITDIRVEKDGIWHWALTFEAGGGA